VSVAAAMRRRMGFMRSGGSFIVGPQNGAGAQKRRNGWWWLDLSVKLVTWKMAV